MAYSSTRSCLLAALAFSHLLAATSTSAVGATASTTTNTNTSGVRAMLSRVLNPGVASGFKLVVDAAECPDSAAACGTVADSEDGVVLTANSLSSLGFVAGKYLERYAEV